MGSGAPRPQEVLHRIGDAADEFKLFWLLPAAAKERFLMTAAASLGFGTISSPELTAADRSKKTAQVLQVLGQRSDQFYVKKAEVGACGRKIMAMKFHVPDALDSTVLACGRLALDRCEPAGSFLPDISVLCKDCLAKRPEVANQ